MSERITVSLPREDVDFIRGFDPDRDRTASRADMVSVIEHLQAALNDDGVRWGIVSDELDRIVAKAKAQLASIEALAAESQRIVIAQRLAASAQPQRRGWSLR